MFHFLSSYITLCSTRHQINNGPTYPILSWTSSCCARPPRGVYRPSPSPPSSFPRVYATHLLSSSLLLPSLLPTGWKRILRKLFPDLSSKARDRFESNRYISMMTNPLFLLPCLPRAEKRKIWRRRESLASLPPPLGFGGRIFFSIEIKDRRIFFFFFFFFIPSLFPRWPRSPSPIRLPKHDDGRLACQDECSADTLLPIGTWRHWKHVTS